MIGKLDPQDKTVAIIGAGISGLLAGVHLKRQGYRVQIFEKSAHAGGLIETEHNEFGLVEKAAHSVLVNETLRIFFDSLAVELSPVHSRSRARYIYRDGAPRRMPLRFQEIISTLWRFFRAPKKSPLDPKTTTLAQWCDFYLGTAAKNYLLAPFVTGVYACTPDDLLVDLAFPKLMTLRSEKLLGRKKKPRAQMMTPTFGMGAVVHALVQELTGCIAFQATVTGPHDSKLLGFKNQVWAIPAGALSKALKNVDDQCSRALDLIHYSSLVTVTCFFDENKMRAPRGVGVLIPRDQDLRTLGVLYNSSAFPNRSLKPKTASLTFMFGGMTDPGAIDLTDLELQSIIRIEAERLFGSKSGALLHTAITRWPQAIPLYNANLMSAHNAMRNGYFSAPGRLVFTNYSGQVSIRGLIESLPQF